MIQCLRQCLRHHIAHPAARFILPKLQPIPKTQQLWLLIIVLMSSCTLWHSLLRVLRTQSITHFSIELKWKMSLTKCSNATLTPLFYHFQSSLVFVLGMTTDNLCLLKPNGLLLFVKWHRRFSLHTIKAQTLFELGVSNTC
jgi:hypothetical protein